MDDKRVITYRQGLEFADIHGFIYFETSAKENINIQEILEIFKELIANGYINYNDQKRRIERWKYK